MNSRPYKFLRAAALSLFVVASLSFVLWQQQKPTLYIIGDSTVRNGDGSGSNNQWGWGSLVAPFFDTTSIGVRNHAIGGRSSRTFINEGRWQRILDVLKPGDYVIMQFGHNDAGPLDDTARARGTIRGIGEESKEIYNPITKKQEVVYTYGWYMRKYVAEAKAKGAIAIICSPVPRNNFKEGKVNRANEDYGKWARETAAATGAFFIDLNNNIADEYEKLGPDQVKTFFPADHTHTNKEGAQVNAGIVVKGIAGLKDCDLRKFLNK
ncbi:rhamnogalacturonan acetylesterase [Paraflavitalea sp. CAU 1676]|uniref:rhamnogalacturonan acetylesterase n=1 Tax=Paraflavitalea sp. CAU 1676 TaxID=3032598 RepID=UPI0023D99620|nr:rhamnogalacturonan acetylesterase [Paraflavitalea sp. CAU 1676]MDF2193671.1 rhamnogalacturonan acetylesterase [Paraflavitalea sp. CAU 1676]